MEDMSALHYENFIRRAHQKGRYGTKGADADIYRELVYDYWEYNSEKEAKRNGEQRTSTKSIETLEKSYRKTADEVKSYISKAIDFSIRKYNKRLNQTQIDELQKCKYDLNSYDINTIRQVIERANKPLLAIGLYPQ